MSHVKQGEGTALLLHLPGDAPQEWAGRLRVQWRPPEVGGEGEWSSAG